MNGQQSHYKIREFIKRVVGFLRATCIFGFLSVWFTILFCLLIPIAIKTPIPRWETWWWCFIAFYAIPVIPEIIPKHLRFNLFDWLIDRFFKNPLAWLIFGVFLIAEHGSYRNVNDLNKICDLLGQDGVIICFDSVQGRKCESGEHDYSSGHPGTIKEEIDNICIEHDPDQYTDN